MTNPSNRSLAQEAAQEAKSCGRTTARRHNCTLQGSGNNEDRANRSMDKKRFGSILAALLIVLPVFLGADAYPVRDARIDNARILPFFASGGGWESTISLINVFETTIVFLFAARMASQCRSRIAQRTAALPLPTRSKGNWGMTPALGLYF